MTLQGAAIVEETLQRLAGRPLAILSNGSPQMLQTGLERAGLRPHLTHVLSVDAVGVYKPAPRVYEEAPRHLGLAPENILFVSGNGWDAAGAAPAQDGPRRAAQRGELSCGCAGMPPTAVRRPPAGGRAAPLHIPCA